MLPSTAGPERTGFWEDPMILILLAAVAATGLCIVLALKLVGDI
jgi:hypothetical protein